MTREHVDVLIVGAGISGVGAASRLQERCPGKSFAILESRGVIGGTWDLFRFPGIRSDSDMFTLSFPFRPWKGSQAIVDGASILDYIRDTAREQGVDRHVRFHHRVTGAEWSSDDAAWTVDVERTDTGEKLQMTCGFIFTCTGYFDYEQGYTPEFPGIERFQGEVVHPQFWSDDVDHADKRVVVIGSGSTAVTLVPALAERATHVTMLQRSPSYIIALPAIDPLAGLAGRVLPERWAYSFVRWKNILMAIGIYGLSRKRPETMKRLIRKAQEHRLPPNFDIDKHLTPRYDPWDQRMCLVPDGDFFEAIDAGRLSIATDRIATFTESGILLESGEELEADMVVTATGLKMQPFGAIRLNVDGEDVEWNNSFVYRGMQLSGVPNMAYSFGYTNQSWTLGAELAWEHVCRLIEHMDRHGYTQVTPRNDSPLDSAVPFADLTSGYIQRALHMFPRQGADHPWMRVQNYRIDRKMLLRSPVDDPALEFSGAARRTPVAA